MKGKINCSLNIDIYFHFVRLLDNPLSTECLCLPVPHHMLAAGEYEIHASITFPLDSTIKQIQT